MSLLTFEPFRVWFYTHHPTQDKGDAEQEVNITTPTFGRIWYDRFPVKTDTILKLCKAYNLEIHEVLRRKQDMNPTDYSTTDSNGMKTTIDVTLTFAPFRVWFITQHPTKKKGHVLNETNIKNNVMNCIWKDKFPVTSDAIEKLCETYDLKVHEVIGIKRNEAAQ